MNSSSSSAPLSSSSSSSPVTYTLATIPKSWRFTESLPPDPALPTPAASHQTPRDRIRPRIVQPGALYSWVRPEPQQDPDLLAVSPAALRDLHLQPSEAESEDFRQTAAGNRLWGWSPQEEAVPEEDMDESGPRAETEAKPAPKPEPEPELEPVSLYSSPRNSKNSGYPWAQCYGGYQFGQWAGQLGDGRAISLFEVPAGENSDKTFEIQLKGAGVTPYSRFADGRAVLRSSIREFVVSEALHALGIPTTRALALTRLPHVLVQRERREPGAIVVRFAESWLRLGTFDLLRSRGQRMPTYRLATYAAEAVLGGWEALPGVVEGAGQTASASEAGAKKQPSATLLDPPRGFAPAAVQGPLQQNRFARLYREVVRRNAATVAHWQAYGFLNGVLNTDNTSLAGLSMDFGPFAFLDVFDPAYTPNHDDNFLRYSYQNQPSVVWWNLTRFGEALGELLAAGGRVDDAVFAKEGLMGLARVDAAAQASQANDGDNKDNEKAVDAAADVLIHRAEDIILAAAEEYKTVFMAEYKRLMAARLGLPTPAPQALADADPESVDPLISDLLDLLHSLQLDFHLFFRRLSALRLADIADDASRLQIAPTFFYRDGINPTAATTDEAESRRRVAAWLDQWRLRLLQHHPEPSAADEHARIRAMKAVNPNFVPRGWILDEVIRRVQDNDDRLVLRRVMHMALHPFADTWHGHTFDGQLYNGDPEEEARWTQDVPRMKRALQCSCSS